ncbi:MAG: cell division protein FtsA [Candidatus Contendobacter sp.]|nr:cell division protein FtsA [Candidatus Contendobacter sp.]
MAKKEDKNLIVGLDIGTSKVVAMVGEVGPDGAIEVISIGVHPSRGLKKGVVVNIESVVQSIKQAVDEAERNAGCKIHSVYTGISGSHIRGLNSDGVTAIRNQEVTADDVEQVIEAARVMAIPADQMILHILPKEFVIDGQEGIQDPVGMSGVRLEARVHIVTGAVNAEQNISKCVQRCGLTVDEIILQPLASSRAVLTQDEKNLGVCLLDIGGGTTDLAVFTNGTISHTAVLPIAGDQVTNDIAIAFHTPTAAAEAIKINHACCLKQLTRADERIDVAGVGDRAARVFSRYDLAEVVEPRYEELFDLALGKLRRSGFENLIPAGVVLTGGSSRIEGVVELAEAVFHMPVRRGTPQGVTGLPDLVCNPEYSTAVGLLLFGNENRPLRSGPVSRVGRDGWWARMRHWFQGNF